MRDRQIKIIAITIVLLVLLVPPIDGYLIKKHYVALIDQWNSQSTYQIQITKYSFGWRHSNVEITVFPPVPPKMQNRLGGGVPFTQVVTHGPILKNPINNKLTFALGGIQTNFHLPPPLEAMLLGASNSQGLLQINSLLHFNNDIDNLVYMPPMSFNAPESGGFNWQGLYGMFDLKFHNQTVSEVDTTFTVGALSLSTSIPSLQFQQLAFTQFNYVSDISLCLWQ